MSHPWRVAVSDVLHSVHVIDQTGKEIAKVYSTRAFEALPDRDREANARLMAAAPDMFQALKELLAEADKYGGDTGGRVLARDAIAKAEGRE